MRRWGALPPVSAPRGCLSGPRQKQRPSTSPHVDTGTQLGFMVTHIDFGSWRVSAHHKLGDLFPGATKISGLAHKYFFFSFKTKSANVLRTFSGKGRRELLSYPGCCSGQVGGRGPGHLQGACSVSPLPIYPPKGRGAVSLHTSLGSHSLIQHPLKDYCARRRDWDGCRGDPHQVPAPTELLCQRRPLTVSITRRHQA